MWGADQGGKVVVETVADGGNGKAADVQVGDIVRGTTARSKAIFTPFSSQKNTLMASMQHTRLPSVECPSVPLCSSMPASLSGNHQALSCLWQGVWCGALWLWLAVISVGRLYA